MAGLKMPSLPRHRRSNKPESWTVWSGLGRLNPVVVRLGCAGCRVQITPSPKSVLYSVLYYYSSPVSRVCVCG